MELRHLRYFLAVARHRNFSRAAKELHLAQPPLSQQIQQLERELKVVLFDRSGRRIELTQAGEVLFQHSLHLFARIDDMLTEVREVAEGYEGKVTLGTNPSSAGFLVPSFIEHMSKRLPEIELSIREASSSSIVDLAIQRHIDLGLARLPLLNDDARTMLIDSQALYQEHALVVVASDHPLSQRKDALRIAELRGEPFLFRDRNAFYHRVMNACQQADFIPRVICEGADTATLLRFVTTGIGIAIVPEYGLKLMPHLSSRLVGIPLHQEQESLTTTMSLVWSRGRYRSHTVRLLEDLIREVAHPSLLSRQESS